MASNTTRAPANNLGKTLRVLNYIFIATIIGIIAVVVVAAGPTLIGKKTYIVMSGSMEPAIPTGAAVVTEVARPNTLREGDVITYITPSEALVTHRIIEIVNDDRGLGFRTQGDANATPDPIITRPPNIMGRLTYGVPFAGYILHYANQNATRLGFMLLAIVIVGTQLQAWAMKKGLLSQHTSEPAPPAAAPSAQLPGTSGSLDVRENSESVASTPNDNRS